MDGDFLCIANHWYVARLLYPPVAITQDGHDTDGVHKRFNESYTCNDQLYRALPLFEKVWSRGRPIVSFCGVSLPNSR